MERDKLRTRFWYIIVLPVLAHFNTLIASTVRIQTRIPWQQLSKAKDLYVVHVLGCISTFDARIVRRVKCGKIAIILQVALFPAGHANKALHTCVVHIAKNQTFGRIH